MQGFLRPQLISCQVFLWHLSSLLPHVMVQRSKLREMSFQNPKKTAQKIEKAFTLPRHGSEFCNCFKFGSELGSQGFLDCTPTSFSPTSSLFSPPLSRGHALSAEPHLNHSATPGALPNFKPGRLFASQVKDDFKEYDRSLWCASTRNCTRNVNQKLDPSANDMATAIYKSIVGKMTVKTCKNARPLGFGPSNKIRSDKFLHCRGATAADSLGWDSQVSPHLLKVRIAATWPKTFV